MAATGTMKPGCKSETESKSETERNSMIVNSPISTVQPNDVERASLELLIRTFVTLADRSDPGDQGACWL